MKLLDANILLHAYDPRFPRQELAAAWLERTVSGSEQIGLAWVTVLAFLRLSTNPRAFPLPLSPEEAGSIISSWLERPNVSILEPTENHWKTLSGLLTRAQARGDLVTDAHLASLAIEHGATLCTNDRDFARFPGLKLLDPLEA